MTRTGVPCPRRRDAGFSLVEVVVALTVMVLSLLGLISGISYTVRTNATISENELAKRAAEKMMETVRSYPVKYAWACFNGVAADAASIPGYTAVSATYPELAPSINYPTYTSPNLKVTFTAEGLVGWKTGVGSARYAVGVIEFAQPLNTPNRLLEVVDATNDPQGLMSDLNSNGTTGESLAVTQAYNMLPVTLTLRWDGITGKRTMIFKYLLMVDGNSTTYPGQASYTGNW